jgi:uncharacterized protein with NRDE domain
MCTVTFFPKTDGYLLTTNRDEDPNRPKALAPTQYIINGKPIYFPMDPQGKGTWVAADDTKTMCLLNGAFEKHKRRESYRHSRGIIVLNAFKYSDPEDFVNNTDVDGIEPFTLIWAEHKQVVEFRWDETQKHVKKLNPKEAHIWSSAPLYNERVRKLREDWLKDFENQHADPGPEVIMGFHLNGGNEIAEEKIKMWRNGGIPSSISVTQIHLSNNLVRMHYLDLLNESRHEISFGAKGNEPR